MFAEESEAPLLLPFKEKEKEDEVKYTESDLLYLCPGTNKITFMKIVKVWFDDENIFVKTDTGHIIGNPINWFTRLKNATPEQRKNYEIGPFNKSLHWNEIDEDLSLESLFDFKRELNYAKI